MVLCLHDAGGNGSEFSGVLDALAASHSPLSFDQPGHGRSGGLDSLGEIAAMAQHARSLGAALGLDAPVLLGDGMGAGVALEAAIADPGWPSALVLCGGAAALFAIADEQIAQTRRIAGGKARREFDPSGFAPGTPREVFQRAFAEWVKTDPRTLLGDRIAQQAWDGRGRLAAITCPVVVVVGEHEAPADKDAAAQLVADLPDGRTAVLQGAGRRGVIEQPAALALLVEELLVGVRS